MSIVFSESNPRDVIFEGSRKSKKPAELSAMSIVERWKDVTLLQPMYDPSAGGTEALSVAKKYSCQRSAAIPLPSAKIVT
jgi:hypothetical protein